MVNKFSGCVDQQAASLMIQYMYKHKGEYFIVWTEMTRHQHLPCWLFTLLTQSVVFDDSLLYSKQLGGQTHWTYLTRFSYKLYNMNQLPLQHTINILALIIKPI